MMWHYDGDLFRRNHGDRLRLMDLSSEFLVFLACSSDGFEEFACRTGSRSTWPTLFVIINYELQYRFQASNAILCSFIPGTHGPTEFHNFTRPILQDLKHLQIGIEVMCADMKQRKLKAYVQFAAFDFPAASKSLGFLGHNAMYFCHRCHKMLEHVPEAGRRYVVPSGSTELCR